MNTKELPACRIRRYCIPPAPHDDMIRRKIVREMHPETAQSWAQLYDEMRLYPIGQPPYEEECRRESRHYFLAIEWTPERRSGRTIGMLVCTPLRQFGHRYGVIHDLIVRRAVQRRGIATELLEAVIAWTREEAHANNTLPINLLQTSVSRRLKSATRFLVKHGFQKITDDDDPYYELDLSVPH